MSSISWLGFLTAASLTTSLYFYHLFKAASQNLSFCLLLIAGDKDHCPCNLWKWSRFKACHFQTHGQMCQCHIFPALSPSRLIQPISAWCQDSASCRMCLTFSSFSLRAALGAHSCWLVRLTYYLIVTVSLMCLYKKMFGKAWCISFVLFLS